MNPSDLSKFIKQTALAQGFSYVGISKAEKLEEEAPRLEQWLNEGRHGSMSYMENHFDKRLDPSLLVPGAKSVISLMYNYHSDKKQMDRDAPKISTYAYGIDYHYIVKEKLKNLVSLLEEKLGTIDGRVFVDSAPVMERAWAAKSGLGWIGKNSLLLNKESGSFYFLAEIISDLEPELDGPVKDFCGTCTACIDACPTDAINEPYKVDGSKCISYFTIELKDEVIPVEVSGKFENWAFGCDICQDVCPWNRFAKKHNEPQFEPKDALLNMTKNEWQDLTEEVFQNIFRKSPVKRTKFKGLKRNIDFLKRQY